MIEDDRRKEYEALRTELRGADLSCQIIVATLATITGAIIIHWRSHWYAAIIVQLIWLFGIMYFAERRFSITRIAAYIYKHIEVHGTGFGYETFLKKITKRPWSLITSLYREVALGAVVSCVIPFIVERDPNPIYQRLSAGFGLAIAIYGVILCYHYQKFRKIWASDQPEES